jgi:HEAT repeat protein
MKNDPIEGAIGRLNGVDPHSLQGVQELGKALESKYSLVVAKAARLAGDAFVAELGPPLASAFARLLAKPGSDKGCTAMQLIARALVQLDYDDADLYRRGMKHVQLEGTWGGSVDVAPEVRAVCAMGLANTRDAKKLQAMVELLADKEWQARAGAVKAIAVTGSEAASLLLRYKALTGDAEADVLSDCLAGLLSVDGAEALPFVGVMAESADRHLSEAALVAMGSSRRADAVEWLKARFGQVADGNSKKAIIRALANARTEGAIEFLLQTIRHGSAPIAISAAAAMGSGDAVLQAIGSRDDAAAIRRGAGF